MRADSISSTSIYRENTTAHFIGSMERAHKCWVWTQIRDITQPCQQFHPHQERFCIEMTMNLPGSLSYVCCFILVMFSNMLLPVEHYPPVNPSCHKHVAVAHHTHQSFGGLKQLRHSAKEQTTDGKLCICGQHNVESPLCLLSYRVSHLRQCSHRAVLFSLRCGCQYFQCMNWWKAMSVPVNPFKSPCVTVTTFGLVIFSIVLV